MASQTNHTRRRTIPIIAGIVGLIAILAVIAVLSGREKTDTTTADGPSEYGDVIISGTALPKLDDPANDPAVGKAIPTLKGTSFDQTPVEVKPGTATLLLFVAHWCPHCQREVPLLTKWITERGGLGTTRLVAVSTSVDPALPNFPPSQWLRREALPAEFIRDDVSGTAASAFGLPGFPYFIAIDAAGKVVGRNSGELPQDQFEALISLAEGKQPLSAATASSSS